MRNAQFRRREEVRLNKEFGGETSNSASYSNLVRGSKGVRGASVSFGEIFGGGDGSPGEV